MARDQDHKATGGFLFIRFMILLHSAHCHYSCNELDNDTTPEAKAVIIINHARML